MCRILGAVVVLSALTGSAFSQTVYGTWQSKTDANMRWVLTQVQDQVHVQEFSGSDAKADYTCNDQGKECPMKYSGHKAKTSFWFNGPMLVELRVEGDNVVKRRFKVADEGNALEVELLPISPPGKPEKIEFARAK